MAFPFWQVAGSIRSLIKVKRISAGIIENGMGSSLRLTPHIYKKNSYLL